ncbi:Hypothetical protein SMB2099_3005 [Serratia marcescens SMB2099]|nr:Hypothetical protein SMB2099_3005 [Serratia marcescens SMB2099]
MAWRRGCARHKSIRTSPKAPALPPTLAISSCLKAGIWTTCRPIPAISRQIALSALTTGIPAPTPGAHLRCHRLPTLSARRVIRKLLNWRRWASSAVFIKASIRCRYRGALRTWGSRSLRSASGCFTTRAPVPR